jgi:hypothetical protein
MKKLLLTVFIVLLVLFGSTYFVGEILQSELTKLLKVQRSPDIKTELIRYQKSFLSAQLQVKVTVPIENETPLEFLIDSDITHYPYKATAINHISLLDSVSADKVNAFFQSKNWISSQMEINILGSITGDIQLLAGSYKDQYEALKMGPLNLTYQYSLIDQSKELAITLSEFEGNTVDAVFNAKGIQTDYIYNAVEGSKLLNYQYDIQLEQFNVAFLEKNILMKGIHLEGENKIGKSLLKVANSNDWKVKEYRDDKWTFTDNHFNLVLPDLSLRALTIAESQRNDPAIRQKVLGELLMDGGTINLTALHSKTPWGVIDGQLNLFIQPGVLLSQVVDNPYLLIDYVNGDLNLSLPQKLSEQANLREPIKMGVLSGVLKQQGEQLIVISTLDRGELTVNGQVIPM